MPDQKHGRRRHDHESKGRHKRAGREVGKAANAMPAGAAGPKRGAEADQESRDTPGRAIRVGGWERPELMPTKGATKDDATSPARNVQRHKPRRNRTASPKIPLTPAMCPSISSNPAAAPPIRTPPSAASLIVAKSSETIITGPRSKMPPHRQGDQHFAEMDIRFAASERSGNRIAAIDNGGWGVGHRPTQTRSAHQSPGGTDGNVVLDNAGSQDIEGCSDSSERVEWCPQSSPACTGLESRYS